MNAADKAKSFLAYCEAHPTERFWQALTNWAEVPYLLVSETPPPGRNLRDVWFLED